MKKVYGVIAIFIAFVLCIPYIMGYIVKDRIYNHYNYLNDIMGQIFEIKIINYNQGWFSSNSEIKIALKSVKLSTELGKKLYPYVAHEYQEKAAEEFSIFLHSKITHGPFIVQNLNSDLPKIQLGIGFIHSTLDIPWNYQGLRLLDYTIGKKQIIQGSTLINLIGNLTNYIELPSMHYINYDSGTIFDWSGLKVTSYDSNNFQSKNVALEILPLHISNMAGNRILDSAPMTISGNFNRDSTNQWNGDINLKLGNLVLSKNDKPYLYIFDIESDNKKILKPDQVDFTDFIKISKINMDGQDYGPFQLWFGIHGINWQVLNGMINRLNETNFFDRDNTELKPFYFDVISYILTMLNGSSLDVTFQSVINNGALLFSTNIDIANQIGDLIYPSTIVKNSHGRFTIVISDFTLKYLLMKHAESTLTQKINEQALLNNEEPNYDNISQYADTIADEQISSLVKNGWIVHNKDLYGADFELKAGIIYNFNVELLNLLDELTLLKH